MEIVKAHEFVWRWNGGVTVNVSDGFREFFCYTLSTPSKTAFLASIPNVLPWVREQYTFDFMQI